VDWTSLSSVGADAAAGLSAFFNAADAGPSQLVFFDTPNLLYVLEQATPQGQAQVERSLWDLRFCMLALMHMEVAFNAAAADFSLTYIENAPVWRPGSARFDGDALANVAPSSLTTSAPSDTPWRLHGNVLGANGLGLPKHPLEPLPERVTIACASLVRMDEGAISQLLQWVRRAKERKVEVHFTNVSLLVATAWAAVDLEAYARISLRDAR
jgi:ABC-type transporter Mla MlaB component